MSPKSKLAPKPLTEAQRRKMVEFLWSSGQQTAFDFESAPEPRPAKRPKAKTRRKKERR
jgi:hypothetical protein